jgi:hypothetical protein
MLLALAGGCLQDVLQLSINAQKLHALVDECSSTVAAIQQL